MRKSTCLSRIWLAAVVLLVGPTSKAQQPQTPDAKGPAIKTTAEEVLLDVVVRDK